MVFVSVFFLYTWRCLFFLFFFPVLYCWLHSGAFFFGRGFGKFGSGLFPMRHRHQTFLSSGCVPVTAGWVINRHLSTKNPTLRLISKAKELWLNLVTKKKQKKKNVSTSLLFSVWEFKQQFVLRHVLTSEDLSCVISGLLMRKALASSVSVGCDPGPVKMYNTDLSCDHVILNDF